jgi:hypothetical protein
VCFLTGALSICTTASCVGRSCGTTSQTIFLKSQAWRVQQGPGEGEAERENTPWTCSTAGSSSSRSCQGLQLQQVHVEHFTRKSRKNTTRLTTHSVAALAQCILNIKCLSKHSFAVLARCLYNITCLSTQTPAALAQCVLHITCLCTHFVVALAHMPCTHTDHVSCCLTEKIKQKSVSSNGWQRLTVGLT